MAMLLWCSLIVLGACRFKERKVELDRSFLTSEIERRSEAAVAKPSVELRLNQLFMEAFGDPALSGRGDALFAKLGSAPELEADLGAVQEEITKLPALGKLARQVAAENPGASPEQIGELVGKKVEGVSESPEFDRAFDRAFQRLLERPAVHGVFQRFGEKIMANEQMQAGIRSVLDTRATDAVLQRRIVELNGGAFPDKGQATRLLLDHAFTEARLEQHYVELFSLPVMRKSIAAAGAEILASPAFERHSRAILVILLRDAAFRQGLVDAFGALLEHGKDEQAMQATLERVLVTPHVERALVQFISELLDDPELQVLGNRALGSISADAEYKKTLGKMLDGW